MAIQLNSEASLIYNDLAPELICPMSYKEKKEIGQNNSGLSMSKLSCTSPDMSGFIFNLLCDNTSSNPDVFMK